MELQIINDIAATAPGPALPRAPEKIVPSMTKTQTGTGQDDAMTPGSDRSQAGLVVEAMVRVSKEETGQDVRGPERVLKPWGIAMLPDDTRDPAQTPGAEATQPTDEPATPLSPDPR